MDSRLVEIAVAVIEHEGRYLVGLRPAGAPLAGLWEFPGGKLQMGETPAAAAQRECWEETGLSVTAGAAYPTVEHEYAHGRLRLHFIACSLRDFAPGTLVPEVAERFRWVPAAELSRYDFPAANAALIELLQQ
jgi:8-oxo-dGTP diphosphatase